MIRSLSATVKVGALLVLIVAGLLFSGLDLRSKPQSAEAASLNEIKKLLASDSEAFDNFGFSVDVSADTAIVGATFEDSGGNNAGAAYIFQRDEGGADNWGEVKKLVASDSQADDGFGVSVAISGDTVLIGANLEDAEASNAGAVYVFERDEGGADNWGEVKKLAASDPEVDDLFGFDVAIDGDTAVAGAINEDTGGNAAGAAYVFQRDEGGVDNWGEVKKLAASDAQAGDQFAYSVAVSGDTTVIGARSEDAAGVMAGAAYVLQRNEGGADNWGEVKKLTASDGAAFDNFGSSVDVSADTAVVGAQHDVYGGSETGAAYVFQRDQGGADTWGEVKKLTASDAQADDDFGWNVAVDNDTVVIGARFEDAAGDQAGAAYVFRRSEGGANNWGELKKLTASDAEASDSFGYSVAISAETTIVGALTEDESGIGAGAAYAFQEPVPTPPSVGGIALDGDADLRLLESPESSSSFVVLAKSIAVFAGALAIGGASWLTRKRLIASQ